MPLRIDAPGSLRPVQTAILDGFHDAVPEVRSEFAPPAKSGVLAQRVHAVAPADLCNPAHTRDLDDLHAAGLASRPRPLARIRLLLVSRAELNPPLRTSSAAASTGCSPRVGV